MNNGMAYSELFLNGMSWKNIYLSFFNKIYIQVIFMYVAFCFESAKRQS